MQRSLTQGVIAVLIFVASGLPAHGSPPAASPGHKPPAGAPQTLAAVRADAEWILSAQLPDGAIAQYPDRRLVEPYLANFAARGLAAAAELTGDRRYSRASWRWLEWYQAHEDTSGYVTTYQLHGDVETSTGSMDSTDSYAGAFLSAALETWQAAGGEATRLEALRKGIEGACRAIASTQDADGLTWAKPSYHVKYLMDQAETYAGLRAAVLLARSLHEPELAARAEQMAAAMRAGVEALWDPATGAYDWAKHDKGFLHKTDWSQLQDACQQAWAVAFGLATGPRARQLMQHCIASQPLWRQPGGNRQYWPVVGWALLQAGQRAAASQGYASIQAAAQATHYAWPYNTAIAGQIIVLLQKLAGA